MDDKDQCYGIVWGDPRSPNGRRLHGDDCHNRARFTVRNRRTGQELRYCGTHVRTSRRMPALYEVVEDAR